MKIPHCCALVALLWILDVNAAEAQCSYSVSPTSFTVVSTASNRTISVITGTQCAWTATSTVSWITIASGAAWTGIGSTTFLVAENSTPSPRTGTFTVAGQTITVTQEAGSCSYSLTPTTFAIGPASTSRTVSIISGTQCSWSATSSVGWIAVTSGATGAGIGSVTFSVAANTGVARTAAVTIAGQPVTVSQAAASGEVPPPAPKNLRIVTGGADH